MVIGYRVIGIIHPLPPLGYSHLSQGEKVSCELWAMSCELWAMGCGLWAMGCELWAMGCELWAVSGEQWAMSGEGWAEVTDRYYSVWPDWG